MDTDLNERDREILITLLHTRMDEVAERNDDEEFKKLAHIARKLGDGQ